MRINVLEDKAKVLIVEFDGVERGIAEMIKSKLNEMKDVEFVSIEKDHPEVGKPRLVVKAEKSPKALVLKAVEKIEADIKELEGMLPKK